MKFDRRFFITCLILLACCSPRNLAAEGQKPTVTDRKLAFRLPTGDGRTVELAPSAETGYTVVCFLGTECPMARLYGPRLQQMSVKLASKPVRFLGVISNSQDSLTDIGHYAQEVGIKFPLLKDADARVADQFGARRMTEVFVLDHTLAIRYQGRIDDQYQPGVARSLPTRDDLRLALDELLAGKPVSVGKTTVTGCVIGRPRQTSIETAAGVPVTPGESKAVRTRGATASTVTYARQASRVFQKHCVECHRPGEIGPFALTEYDEITGWSETILEALDAGRMPPWHADPAHGSFANARQMPESDKQILRDWIKAGMPFGNRDDLPSIPGASPEWQLSRAPDLILPMRVKPFAIPATGTVDYQYFVVDPGFKEDRWVKEAQVIPGNRAVVHHCIIFIRPPDGAEFRGVGWLNGYVPGQRNVHMSTGRARKIPAGSKLVFQMHYTPNGVAQEDLTKVGMIFAPESEVTHEVFTVLAINQDFEIPPGATNHSVQAQARWFPKQGELLAIVPHMHVRGKSFQAIQSHGGKNELLLNVPRYDFNWQHVYVLSEPLSLSHVDALEINACFDNSKGNPANPDPTQTVTWGDQTWEEMAVAFFEISVPRNVDVGSERDTRSRRPTQSSSTVDVTRFVDDFFKRFDRDGNGTVERSEPPLSFRTYGFDRFDQDSDGRLTRSEIEAAARERANR